MQGTATRPGPSKVRDEEKADTAERDERLRGELRVVAAAAACGGAEPPGTTNSPTVTEQPVTIVTVLDPGSGDALGPCASLPAAPQLGLALAIPNPPGMEFEIAQETTAGELAKLRGCLRDDDVDFVVRERP